MARCTPCLTGEGGKEKKQCWEKSYIRNTSQQSAPEGCSPPLRGVGEGRWLVLSSLTDSGLLSRVFAAEMA